MADVSLIVHQTAMLPTLRVAAQAVAVYHATLSTGTPINLATDWLMSALDTLPGWCSTRLPAAQCTCGQYRLEAY